MNHEQTNSQSADLERLATGAVRFLSEPASPRPLAIMRIGLASVLLLQGLALSVHLLDLYGNHGVVQWIVTDPAVGQAVPRIRWLVEVLGRFGVDDGTAVRGLFAVYLGSLAALLLGYRTRSAALVAWFTHLMMNTSATATVYGVDSFANIALFYCTWMPVGAAFSADRAAGRTSDEPTAFARLALRVLQIHLCVVYLATGIEKSMGADWWNGEAIWSSLMRSDLCKFDMSWLAQYPLVAVLAGWGTLAVELGYALFIWPKQTRRLWAVSTIGMHVGIAIFLGLASFAALMSVLTFSAFCVSAEPTATPVFAELKTRVKRLLPALTRNEIIDAPVS